ncbi:CHAT domain-containing protein, partial [candidate division KSB1 bacterium]
DIQEKILGNDHPDLAYTYSRFGNIYFKLKDYEKAIDYLRKALIIRREFYGSKHPLVAFSYNNLGIVFHDLNKYDRALQLYQKALIANVTDFSDTNRNNNPTFENILSKPYLLETLKKKANAFYFRYINESKSRDDLKKALNTFDLAIALMDIIRNEFKVEDSKLFLSEQAKSTFSNAVNAALELNYLESEVYLEKAFGFVEKSKSASLLAQLYESNARRFSGIPDSLLSYERKLKSDILFFQTMIQNERSKKETYDPELTGKWTRQFNNLSGEYDSLISYFEKNYPRYYNLKYENKVASVRDIQIALDNETAILEYFITSNRLYIFVITSGLFRVATVPIDDGFETLIINYYRSLKKVETRVFAKYSAALYNFLIRPVYELIDDKNKFIIIPDDYLFYIPFETLVSDDLGGKFESDFSKYDYLLNQHTFSYHYSANIWHNSLNEAKIKASQPERFVGFAPIFKEEEDGNYTFADNSISIAGNDISTFPDIVYAQEEVKSIDRLFSKKNYDSDVFYRMDATESKFKKQSKGYKYVHIATHGFSNDDQPDLSGLVFSLSPPEDVEIDPDLNGRKEDGILYSGEMFNLDLNADLVVLSACEGGIGKLIRGEGLIAMTRGFLYSGTPNIVFSLWRVSDIHTKDLMIYFYKNLLSEQDYDDALRNAKLEMIKDRKTAFPKFWGGFVLVGI